MSTGSTTQAASFQEKQSKVEHDDSRSALFYLFQEVSKLASTTHSSLLDTSQPSTQLKETSKKDPLVIKEEDPESLQTSDGSCQHNLSHMLLYSQLKNAQEEGRSSNLVEPQKECKSPWKVLNLINLHCEKLLYEKDVRSDSKTVNQSEPRSSAPHVTEEEVRGDQSPLKPSYFLKDGSITSVSPVGDGMQSCVNKPDVVCTIQTQTAKKTVEEDALRPDLLEDKGPAVLQRHHNEVMFSIRGQLEWKQECDKDEQDSVDTHLSPTSTHMHSVPLNTHLTLNSNDEDGFPLSKPALTLDHNANITLSSGPVQCPPSHSVLPSSQSAEICLLSSKQDDEVESTREASRLNPSSCNVNCTTSEPEVLTEHQEEEDFVSMQRWRAKTPRKQPHPSRSVDIQDPDFQGVTFRMDRELDDNTEQCRLLITSKYSKELCKRKLRLRTRASQKSLRTSSSDEEIDLMAHVFKGKVCASCCTRKTPMWRDAEDGTPLCNACGIRYKKYRVRCVNCWHIPRKEGNSNPSCLKCGNFVGMTSAE